AQLLLSERNKLSESNEKLAREIEDRKAVTMALQDSEEKHRTILETIEDAYFEVDLRGSLTFFNRALIDQMGYTADEMIGRHYRDLTDEQNAAKLRGIFENIFVTQKAGQPVDVEVISKANGVRTVSLLASPIFDREGRVKGFRGLARDITEYKAMEGRLQRARKMEALGALAGGVAHDLNNTLSGIVSYPELLLMNMSETDPLRKPITAIMKSGEKAAAIVQDLLTLAKRGVIVKEATNLNGLIQEYLQSTEFQNLQAAHPGVTIETRLDPSLFNLNGSVVHLSKTLMNLVINAVESIKTAGTVTITTANHYIEHLKDGADHMPEGDYVALIVRDNGEGIAPADLDKIYEPFFTRKKMGRSGTGLGMAVVWGAVKDHQGQIDVQSREGEGTTFTLYFPATRAAVMKKDPGLSFDHFRGEGESILVVDDIETQRQVATEILNALGYSASAVESGEAAVAYLKTRSVDLLLLDMIMRPGIDGLETYRRIIEFHPGQKAIIASGFSETERVFEAQRLGAGTYIKKPYSIEKLGLAIRKELMRDGGSQKDASGT
ncbi:MAG: PAS domain S-box protein, partial [Smithellaceae bacterium]